VVLWVLFDAALLDSRVGHVLVGLQAHLHRTSFDEAVGCGRGLVVGGGGRRIIFGESRSLRLSSSFDIAVDRGAIATISSSSSTSKSSSLAMNGVR
jgi:hypothetical protein